jgi:hypothetical protein
MKRILLSITASILFANIYGQEIIMAHPDGYLSAKIDKTDTLDGLYEKNGAFELIPVEITWKMIYEEGLEIEIPHYEFHTDEKPIMYFKNHDFIKSKIQGILLDDKFIFPDSSIFFRLDNNPFTIYATGDIAEKKENYDFATINNYTVYVEYENKGKYKTTMLISFDNSKLYGNFIYAPKIIWMGDLDDDGLLDFIIDERDYYMCLKYGLYLSSNIQNGSYNRELLIIECCMY